MGTLVDGQAVSGTVGKWVGRDEADECAGIDMRVRLHMVSGYVGRRAGW